MDKEKILIEEIKIIQDIIKRMAGNSFLIKGWTLTLVVAPFLLKADTTISIQFMLAFIPLSVFWILDSYYLRQERMYKCLHKWVAENRMNTEQNLFDFSTGRFENQVPTLFNIALSNTIYTFYGGITILVLAYRWFLCR